MHEQQSKNLWPIGRAIFSPFSKPRELDDTRNSFISEIMEHEVFLERVSSDEGPPTPAVIGRPPARFSSWNLARGH